MSGHKLLAGKDGIFSGIVKDVLETMLSEELNQHLSSEQKDLGSNFDNPHIQAASATRKASAGDRKLRHFFGR